MRMAGQIPQGGGLELDNMHDTAYAASSRKRGNELPGDGAKRSRFSPGDHPEPAEEEKVALIIENLFDGNTKLGEYATKVEADTRVTCGAFGNVAMVEVAVPAVAMQQPVFVEFYQASQARAAAENLSSRTYDGRYLSVRRVSTRQLRAALDDYRQVKKEMLEDSKQIGGGGGGGRETARLRSDLAHHSAQHKLLQARVNELEEELEMARASARKDREYHAARVKALTERSEALEADRRHLL